MRERTLSLREFTPSLKMESSKTMGLSNKREMIQTIIDDEPEPWIIMKPSRKTPADPEPLCIFENPAADTQARVEIPLEWFEQRELGKIKEFIQEGLRRAEIKK